MPHACCTALPVACLRTRAAFCTHNTHEDALTPARRKQLVEAAAKHNAARNIGDPGAEAMAGIRQHVGVVDPSCEVYPASIGGNPTWVWGARG